MVVQQRIGTMQTPEVQLFADAKKISTLTNNQMDNNSSELHQHTSRHHYGHG